MAEDPGEEVQPREVERLQDADDRKPHAQGILDRAVDLLRDATPSASRRAAVTPRATWKLFDEEVLIEVIEDHRDPAE